ncbi:MAG: stage II sporulation protein P [Firmicutes bacterium]|nr:stage II sporulation protein P [Bacillota bacterium]
MIRLTRRRLLRYAAGILLLALAAGLLPAGAGAVDWGGLLLRSAGLPALSQAAETAAGDAAEVTAELPEETLLVLARPRAEETAPAPQAVIYCTHTSEEYLGQSRQKGVAGGVLAAARALAQELEEAGIGVILDETVHDTDYDGAYAHALSALEATAAAYPEISLYIDVHRDSALAGISTTLGTDEGDLAKMLLIVGSDEQLPHPHWQENYAFARQVAEAANRLQPGIMREPRVYSGRYNQHIGSRALLVEIGSTDNTQAEAERSAALLAQAITACL